MKDTSDHKRPSPGIPRPSCDPNDVSSGTGNIDGEKSIKGIIDNAKKFTARDILIIFLELVYWAHIEDDALRVQLTLRSICHAMASMIEPRFLPEDKHSWQRIRQQRTHTLRRSFRTELHAIQFLSYHPNTRWCLKDTARELIILNPSMKALYLNDTQADQTQRACVRLYRNNKVTNTVPEHVRPVLDLSREATLHMGYEALRGLTRGGISLANHEHVALPSSLPAAMDPVASIDPTFELDDELLATYDFSALGEFQIDPEISMLLEMEGSCQPDVAELMPIDPRVLQQSSDPNQESISESSTLAITLGCGEYIEQLTQLKDKLKEMLMKQEKSIDGQMTQASQFEQHPDAHSSPPCTASRAGSCSARNLPVLNISTAASGQPACGLLAEYFAKQASEELDLSALGSCPRCGFPWEHSVHISSEWRATVSPVHCL